MGVSLPSHPHPLPLGCTLSLSRKHFGCTGCKCHEKLSAVIKSFLGVRHFILNEEKSEKNEKNISFILCFHTYQDLQNQNALFSIRHRNPVYIKHFGFVCEGVHIFIPIQDWCGHTH